MKYVALLRGINVGGKNTVSMAELRKCFEKVGFKNVITYINSGNIIFDTTESDTSIVVKQCENAIENQFGFKIVCCVIATSKLKEALAHAPAWWGNDTYAKHNAIFVIAPMTTEDVMNEVGEEKPDYEKIAAYQPIIFWSAPLATFSRTRYSKIVGTKAYKFVTIRNANTTKKLVYLCS
jgi:uncharacterized protein (DUF1697 family)